MKSNHLWMNLETGELLTYDEMVEQAREWYDLDDKKNVYTASGKELTEKGFDFVSRIDEPTEESEGGFVKTAKVYVYTKK
jgi:hypothetical protein